MRTITSLLIAIVLVCASPAHGHHSFAMFDQARIWTWEGTVGEFQWSNPHIHIIVDVTSGTNTEVVGRWDFEGESVSISARQGWTRKSFAAGDKITVVGHPAKTGDRQAMLKYAVTGSGVVLYHSIDRNITPENVPK
jgi:hypothetical protein